MTNNVIPLDPEADFELIRQMSEKADRLALRIGSIEPLRICDD